MLKRLSQKRTPKCIMDAANGEKCTFNIVGVCCHDSEKTVTCHLPDKTGGSNRLTGSLHIAFGCHDCHYLIDNHNKLVLRDFDREFYMRRAHNRTINRLIDLELIVVKGLK